MVAFAQGSLRSSVLDAFWFGGKDSLLKKLLYFFLLEELSLLIQEASSSGVPKIFTHY